MAWNSDAWQRRLPGSRGVPHADIDDAGGDALAEVVAELVLDAEAEDDGGPVVGGAFDGDDLAGGDAADEDAGARLDAAHLVEAGAHVEVAAGEPAAEGEDAESPEADGHEDDDGEQDGVGA